MEDNAQIEVMSTKRQIEEFKKDNLVWKDIEHELKIWLKAFEVEKSGIVDDAATENPSTAAVLLHIGDLNGRKKAINYILTLPDVFLSILEEKKNDISSE